MAVTRPKQNRSEESFHRILDAAEQLLEERWFDDLSVTEICEAAGRSVGAFYARFGDKEGLLQELDERYLQEIVSIGDRFVEHDLPRCDSLYDAAGATVRAIAAVYGTRPGLMRSLILRSRIRPDEQISARQQTARTAIPRALAALTRFSQEIAASDTAAALESAFYFTVYATREATLWDATGRVKRIGTEQLYKELTHIMWSALTRGSREE